MVKKFFAIALSVLMLALPLTACGAEDPWVTDVVTEKTYAQVRIMTESKRTRTTVVCFIETIICLRTPPIRLLYGCPKSVMRGKSAWRT